MKNKLTHILNTLGELEPPKHLKDAVLFKISLARQQKLQRKQLLFKFAFAVSGILTLVAAYVFGSQLVASDFWSIGMLSFSDMGSVAAHWQEFGMSLLETFPALSVAGMLLPVFVFMLLLKQYAQQFSNQWKFKLI